MDIQNQTDTEILDVAEKMYSEMVAGSNARDWSRFSQFMEDENKHDQKAIDNVREQWENAPVLTSLAQKRELLGILRREDHVLVAWKQWSTIDNSEYLARLHMKTVGNEIKTIGIFLN